MAVEAAGEDEEDEDKEEEEDNDRRWSWWGSLVWDFSFSSVMLN